MKAKWVKDPKVEHHLRDLGIKYDVRTVAMVEIDRKESMNRQTRFGEKLNEDWVLEYATQLESGSPFPMTILNRRIKVKDKPYFIWSGNHRIGSADLIGEETVEAYVVEVSDPRLEDVLPRVVNAWEGRRPPREELLANAKFLVESHSMPRPDACRLLGLQSRWLDIYLRSEEVGTKINEVGLKAGDFPPTTKLKLSPIAQKNKNTLRELCQFLHKYKIKGTQLDDVLRDVKGAETESEASNVIARWRENVDKRSKKPQMDLFRMPVRQKFLDLFGRTHRLLEQYDTLEKLQMVEPADQKLARELWRGISKHINGLFGE
jgi:hypothetical protein